MRLLQLTKKLYRLSGKLNLYTSISAQKNNPKINRIKKEIIQIKQVVCEIEKILDECEF